MCATYGRLRCLGDVVRSRTITQSSLSFSGGWHRSHGGGMEVSRDAAKTKRYGGGRGVAVLSDVGNVRNNRPDLMERVAARAKSLAVHLLLRVWCVQRHSTDKERDHDHGTSYVTGNRVGPGTPGGNGTDDASIDRRTDEVLRHGIS